MYIYISMMFKHRSMLCSNDICTTECLLDRTCSRWASATKLTRLPLSSDWLSDPSLTFHSTDRGHWNKSGLLSCIWIYTRCLREMTLATAAKILSWLCCRWVNPPQFYTRLSFDTLRTWRHRFLEICRFSRFLSSAGCFAWAKMEIHH